MQTTGGSSKSSRNKNKTSQQVAVAFKLNAPNAKKVLLAGDFTNWQTAALPMKRTLDGTWQTEITLKPGQYQYKFIVDDNWQNDPNCAKFVPNIFGTVNNVIEVK